MATSSRSWQSWIPASLLITLATGGCLTWGTLLFYNKVMWLLGKAKFVVPPSWTSFAVSLLMFLPALAAWILLYWAAMELGRGRRWARVIGILLVPIPLAGGAWCLLMALACARFGGMFEALALLSAAAVLGAWGIASGWCLLTWDEAT